MAHEVRPPITLHATSRAPAVTSARIAAPAAWHVYGGPYSMGSLSSIVVYVLWATRTFHALSCLDQAHQICHDVGLAPQEAHADLLGCRLQACMKWGIGKPSVERENKLQRSPSSVEKCGLCGGMSLT